MSGVQNGCVRGGAMSWWWFAGLSFRPKASLRDAINDGVYMASTGQEEWPISRMYALLCKRDSLSTDAPR